MIKYREQRVENEEWVEGHFTATRRGKFICNDDFHYLINPDTLQVLTTDGWAAIADVEVVRKNHISNVEEKEFFTQDWFCHHNGKYTTIVNEQGIEVCCKCRRPVKSQPPTTDDIFKCQICGKSECESDHK